MEPTANHRQIIERAIALAGGQQALARAMGCSQGHVWGVLHRGRPITAEMAVAIERATKGEINRSEIRPDLWPVPVVVHHEQVPA